MVKITASNPVDEVSITSRRAKIKNKYYIICIYLYNKLNLSNYVNNKLQ